MPFTVSVGHSGLISRPLRRLSSVMFDSDCIRSLSLLILYFFNIHSDGHICTALRRDCYNEPRAITQRSLYIYTYDRGAPIAQLGGRRTLDRKVAGSILTHLLSLYACTVHMVIRLFSIIDFFLIDNAIVGDYSPNTILWSETIPVCIF